MTPSGPIIVTGADRSGTTLLYSILASHPEISMVRRTNMWRWFYGEYGDLGDGESLDRCLAEMTRYGRLRVLEPDPDHIRRAFAERRPTYGELFSVMHEQHAVRRGRSRWADKSLHTEHHAGEIFAELPEARILHMVRDPRDRYASIVRRYEDRTKSVGAAMGRWLASVRVGKKNAREFGEDRYRLVRYETLASSPESTTREICSFIGEPYEPEMLELRGVLDAADPSGNSSFDPIGAGTISTRSIGRFRSVVDESTTAVIQAIAGRWMKIHDYEAAPLGLNGMDRLRLGFTDLPVQSARTAGWLLRRRISARRGRAVPTHRLAPVTHDGAVT